MQGQNQRARLPAVVVGGNREAVRDGSALRHRERQALESRRRLRREDRHKGEDEDELHVMREL